MGSRDNVIHLPAAEHLNKQHKRDCHASLLLACIQADRRLRQAHLICLMEGGVDVRRVLVHEGDDEALEYKLCSLLGIKESRWTWRP